MVMGSSSDLFFLLVGSGIVCQRIELAHVGETMSVHMVLVHGGVPSIEGEGGYHCLN